MLGRKGKRDKKSDKIGGREERQGGERERKLTKKRREKLQRSISFE